MDMKLEVVPVPVRDVDAAKDFYTRQVGFRLDHDVSPGETMRVVQMTPPGSACSVVIGEGLPLGEPIGGHLLFAGEHTQSTRLAYTDAAMTSGIREAKRLLGQPSVRLGPIVTARR